jgi:hypothetical protein
VALFYRAAQLSTVLSLAAVCHCPRNLQYRIFLRLALRFHGTANSLSNDLNCSTTISTATRSQSLKSCLSYGPLSEAAKLPQIYMPFLRWLLHFEFDLHGMSSLLLFEFFLILKTPSKILLARQACLPFRKASMIRSEALSKSEKR